MSLRRTHGGVQCRRRITQSRRCPRVHVCNVRLPHTGQDDENVVLGASARAAAFPVLPAQVGLSASSSVGGRSQHALQPAFRVVRHAAEEAAG